jgi:hypothetical protein
MLQRTTNVHGVTDEEVRQRFGMSDLMLRKACLLFGSTNLFRSSGYTKAHDDLPSQWHSMVAPAIRDYRKVRTLEDYLQARQNLTEGRRARSSQTNFTLAAASPYRLLPLAEEEAMNMNDVFIVYGHSRSARFEVAHYIQSQLGLRAIMLDEIPEALSMGGIRSGREIRGECRFRCRDHDPR